MATHFHVRATSGDNRVVLWERSEVHPQGEVFVAGAGHVLVGMTRRVQQLLHEGLLELVEAEQPDEGSENLPAGDAESTVALGEVSDSPPAADPSPAEAEAKEDELENELVRIDGISQTRLKALQKLGVNSYADLLEQDSAGLADALPRVNVAMVEDWKAQARALMA